MTTPTPPRRPFDPQKVLWDAISAEKAKLLAELPQAAEPHALEIRKDIEACEFALEAICTRRLTFAP